MADRPDQQLLDVRMHALTLAVGATMPLHGIQVQLDSTNLADYFEAWLLRSPVSSSTFDDVHEEMEQALIRPMSSVPADQPGGTT
jgi:hypothetical protein